jgi:hypothetical protein
MAETEVGMIHGLVWMPIIGKLNCLSQVRDGVFDIRQLAKAVEAASLADTEVG